MQSNLVTDRLFNMKEDPSSPYSRSLYSHLCKLIPQLSAFESDKIPPITNLEYISEYLKKNQYSHETPFNQLQLLQFLNRKVQYPNWLKVEEELEKIKGEEKGTEERVVVNFDLQAERLFGKVGVGVGREEACRIHAALKRIAQEQQAVRVRFWGKILTRTGDYLVIEGSSKKEMSADTTGNAQKPKEGVNYNTFWVSHSSLSTQWEELPLITPQQMQIARLIKQTFSGELDHPITSSPPFPGLEKHMLKAQLVRITHNCEIVPKGMYAPLQENAEEVDYAEDFKMPEFAELSNLENWVHFNPNILKQGRASYYVDPKVPEEQREELLAKLAETDPKIERLKAINEDKGLQKFGLEGCWSVRTYGSTQLFNNVGKDEGSTSCYAVAALRNPHWPGWVTVASAKELGSIYIGYGHKASQLPFFPLGPEDLGQEAEDVDECHEPNPKDPPDELQPDSDEENKKEE